MPQKRPKEIAAATTTTTTKRQKTKKKKKLEAALWNSGKVMSLFPKKQELKNFGGLGIPVVAQQ